MDIFSIKQTPEDSVDNEFIDACLRELDTIATKNEATWDAGERILENLDLNSNTITIHYSDNRIVVAEVAMIGTYSPSHSDFLWAYANPTVSSKSAKTSQQVAEWAKMHGLPGLAGPALSNIPVDAAWDILAVAQYLTGAEAATIFQSSDDVYSCLILKNVKQLH